MKVVAFLGSPREEGNTEILLNEALRAVKEQNCSVKVFRPSRMQISPCLNCGGCEKTGVCVIEDDMQEVYEAIVEGDRFILASPIFFFGLSAQLKALVDRCQAIWCAKYLLNKPITAGKYGRKGLVLLVGGMKRQIGFDCGGATATAFFRTISIPEHETLTFKEIDAKGAIKQHPSALKEVYEAARRLVSKKDVIIKPQ